MTFLPILLAGGFAIAAAAALIRGLMAFFRDAEHLRAHGARSEAFGLQQNRMTSQIVLYQDITVFLRVLLGSLASQR